MALDRKQIKAYKDVEIYVKNGSNAAIQLPNIQNGCKISLEGTNVDLNVMKHGDMPIKRYNHATKAVVELTLDIESKHALAELFAGGTFASTSASDPFAGTMAGSTSLACADIVDFYIYPLFVDCASDTEYIADNSNPEAWKIPVFQTSIIEWVFNNDSNASKTLTFDSTIDANGDSFAYGAGLANPAV